MAGPHWPGPGGSAAARPHLWPGRPLLEKSSVVRISDVTAQFLASSAAAVTPYVVGVLAKFTIDLGNERFLVL